MVGVCHHYAVGTCRFGTRCKFSHERRDGGRTAEGKTTSTNGTTRPRVPWTAAQRRFKAWERMVPKSQYNVVNLHDGLEDFFATALQLMDEDAGVRQDVVASLASDGGLIRINELIGQDLHGHNTSVQVRILGSEIMPFLKIITHLEVITSPILEHHLGVIYNYVYGVNGRRIRPLLSSVAGFIPHAVKQMEVLDFGAHGSVLRTLTTFLATLFELNGSAALDTSLHTIVQNLVKAWPEPPMDAQQSLAKIQRHIDIGLTVPIVEEPLRPSESLSPAVFRLHQDAPGGRHDNDHDDICKIRILPSYQEIESTRAEYLPTIDGFDTHLQGLDALLDRNFRLLREDTIGQLRDAVGHELNRVHPKAYTHHSDKKQSAVRTFTYKNVGFLSIGCTKKDGPYFVLGVPEPRGLSGYPKARKERFWAQSHRLAHDALICIFDEKEKTDLVFCKIVNGPNPDESRDQPNESKDEQDEEEEMYEQEQKYSCEKAGIIRLSCSLVANDEDDTSTMLGYMMQQSSNLVIVEFPGILLDAFRPTLLALQRMKADGELPFKEMLIPRSRSRHQVEATQVRSDTDDRIESGLDGVRLEPPAYARKAGFRLNLKCLTKAKKDIWLDPNADFNMNVLESSTTLDHQQAVALVHGLSRELALIQGPPGTGKSFVGIATIKVLIDNAMNEEFGKRAKIGPVICVCYTNHALDQLLEDLHEHGIKQIIRVGSRSKSEILKSLNLRVIAKNMTRTKQEKKLEYDQVAAMQDAQLSIEAVNRARRSCFDGEHFVQYVKSNYPRQHAELFERVDADGWEVVGPRKRTPSSTLTAWLSSGAMTPVHRPLEAILEAGVYTLSQPERLVLYNSWCTTITNKLKETLMEAVLTYEQADKRRKQLFQEADLRCLQDANVIGLTTSGLARNLDVLRRCKAKVMVCEEAGEVLEAHTLTAFLPSVEHAILIGDHLQLRPQIQNFELQRENPRGQQYSLDVSLFERLVQPRQYGSGSGLPYVSLATQRRMHPSISELVSSFLYPQLKDHPHVTQYPPVAGMERRLFWLDHSQPETGAQKELATTTSHTNEYEVRMVGALLSHLVRQGKYGRSDIAVLTPYLGQLRRLRDYLSNSYEIAISARDQDALAAEDNVEPEKAAPTSARSALLQSLRIATVDNFQGEEAEVVVVSLVRSNEERRCGFLRTSNRINVLLSRAKHGMYLIGNADTYGTVDMWANAIHILKRDGNFGSALALKCPRHLDKTIAIAGPDEFATKSPEGGCDKRCGLRLSCGHTCKQNCHASHIHDAVSCTEDCPRPLKGCDHPCTLRCGDRCRPCNAKITLEGDDRSLPCGHGVDTLLCWQHQDRKSIRCKVMVERQVPGCGHTVHVRCADQDIVSSKMYRCPEECKANLPCGHNCTSKCHQCRPRRNGVLGATEHARCTQKCGRNYSNCSHACQAECHSNSACELCTAPCDSFCSHSSCNRKCHEPCAPCAEKKCASSCPHSHCLLPCAAPCSWLPCSKRCEKLLSCGHQCPSVCGEQCPTSKFCQVCCDENVKDACVDYITLDSYGSVDLDSEPCIVPTCGHIITLSSMDGQMAMHDHYIFDENKKVVGVKKNLSPFDQNELKRCPSCRGSLRNIARYGRIVRRALLDASTKRFITTSQSTYTRLLKRLSDLQYKLAKTQTKPTEYLAGLHELCQIDTTRKKAIAAIPKDVRNTRYNALLKLRQDIASFVLTVDIQEQPFSMMYNHVQNVRRRHGEDVHVDLDNTVIQTRGLLLARTLQLSCDLTMLADFIAVRDLTAADPTSEPLLVDLKPFRVESEEVIKLAESSHQIRCAIEAHNHWANAAALELSVCTNDDEETRTLVNDAMTHLQAARESCIRNPGTSAGLLPLLEGTETALKNRTTYMPVTNEEMRQVVAAMATEFSTTGHWYYCENNHPFTVGECGMPMQEARCPQCGSPVGGRHHQAAAGVTRARDLEEAFGELNIAR